MFKTCTSCEYSWDTLNAFLIDPLVELVGYQANLGKPGEGFFLFNHERSSCHSTLAIRVALFQEMVPESIPSGPLIRGPLCEGLCFIEDNFEACHQENCEGNLIRRILLAIRRFQQQSRGTP